MFQGLGTFLTVLAVLACYLGCLPRRLMAKRRGVAHIVLILVIIIIVLLVLIFLTI